MKDQTKNFDYSRTSDKYEEIATIQKAASKTLLDLLNIQKEDDVLDLGCGPGHLTEQIRKITNGRVVGVDKYPGMISQAKGRANKNIEFLVSAAEDITFKNEFDIIFSNSAFHWFPNPQKALDNCFRALRAGGKIGLQCPATNNAAPTILKAVDAIRNKPKIKRNFAHLRPVWFFLDSIEEYYAFFERSDFKIEYAEIITQKNRFDLQQVTNFFKNAAAPRYLNSNSYDIEITEEYRNDFLHEVNAYFAQNLDDNGYIDFSVTRLYAIAQKPHK